MWQSPTSNLALSYSLSHPTMLETSSQYPHTTSGFYAVGLSPLRGIPACMLTPGYLPRILYA